MNNSFERNNEIIEYFEPPNVVNSEYRQGHENWPKMPTIKRIQKEAAKVGAEVVIKEQEYFTRQRHVYVVRHSEGITYHNTAKGVRDRILLLKAMKEYDESV